MNDSRILSLPYIQPAQAQKHVTHNEAVKTLDVLVQLSVLDRDQTVPPASPQEGDRHLVDTGATGVWAGYDGYVAAWLSGVWVFHAPLVGWQAYVQSETLVVAYDGSQWHVPAQNMSKLGVNGTADDYNKFLVQSEGVIFNHVGGHQRTTLNKNASGDDASHNYQTNWSSRALVGLLGSDDYSIKASPDGSSFYDAMVVDNASGAVSFPSGASAQASSAIADSPLVTAAYIASRGTDLVTNGTGLLGTNYNYPADYLYDPTVTPSLPAGFSLAGYYPGQREMSEYIAVDSNNVYRLSAYLRQEAMAGDWSAYTDEERHLQFMGVLCFDADKQLITPAMHMRHYSGGQDSLTELSAPLSPGDTEIHVLDAAGWNDATATAETTGVVIFGYSNSFGHAYDYYSRHHEVSLFAPAGVDKVTHTITLSAPLPAGLANPDDPGGTWPAGTRIANSASDGADKYAFFSSLICPATDTWYKTTNHMGGIDKSGTNVTDNFPPGTAFVKVMWLPNYSNRSGGWSGYPDTGSSAKVWFSGVSVTPEVGALTQVAANGAIDIKIPEGDFVTGNVSMVVAGLSTTEVN